MPKTGLSPDELLEKIIELAESKIRLFGFERFTLTDLARELHVSHAALYKYVPGKDALLDIVSQRWLSRMDKELESEMGKELPAKEAILSWFCRYYSLKKEKVLKDPEIYRSFNMSVEAEKPFVQQHLSELSRQLGILVERAKNEGGLQAYPTAETVRILLDSTTPFHHPQLVSEQKNLERTSDLKRLVATVLAGLQQ